MPFTRHYMAHEPAREDVEALAGDTLLEFGTSWCGHCIAAQAPLEAALAGRELRHLKIEDGRGRSLGRAFRIKLWPTLVLLRDGNEVARVVRPTSVRDVAQLLERAAVSD